MRTRKSTFTFKNAFILDDDVGELPGGSYDVEIDEDEIVTGDRTAYRRMATYFFVTSAGSTRMIVLDPLALDAALERDVQSAIAADPPAID